MNLPLKSTDTVSLSRLLSTQCNSHRITLTDCFIGDQGLKILIPFLFEHPTITILELKGNNISPTGFAQLCEALQLQTNLTSLICEWNNIGFDEKGIQSLVKLLQSNKNLIHVDLRNNKLGIAEAKIIGSMLKKNTTLLSLDLRWNEIRNKGIAYILEGLNENFTLIYLEIQGNNISGENQKAIDVSLEKNRAQNRMSKEDVLGNKRENMQEMNYILKEKEYNQYFENIENTGVKEQALYLNKLEDTLAVERKVNREISERLNKEIDRLRNKEIEDQRFFKDYHLKVEIIQIENESLKKGVNLLRKDVETIQMGSSKTVKFEENRLKQQEIELENIERSHKIFMEKQLDEHNRNVKELSVDWEDHYRLLENRIKDIQGLIIGLQSEEKDINYNKKEILRKNEEEFNQIQMKRKEGEEFFNSFRLRDLEQQIEINRLNLMGIIKRNGNLANEFKGMEEKFQNEIGFLEEEYAHLKQEHDVFFQKNQEFVLLLDKLNLELAMKKGKGEKMEKEINELKEKQKKKKHHSEKENLHEQNKKQEEKEHWVKDKENLIEKIAEMEQKFCEASNENLRLKNDRQRLLKNIQSGISKTVYEVFSVNRYI